MLMLFNIALRLFLRELRRGELTIIAGAVFLAVFSVYTLSSVADRISGALEVRSASFLAADRLLFSAHPLDKKWLKEAEKQGLAHAEVLYFRSMVFSNGGLQLARVKAVSEKYPLRGELIISDQTGSRQANAPEPGTIWVEPRLLSLLQIKLGDKIEIGDAQLQVSAILEKEPDGSLSVFASAPRVIMRDLDVAKTNVIQPGSRLSYNFLFAGETSQLLSFGKWLKPQLKENQQWRSVKDSESFLSESVLRAERFLILSGLLGIVLAATAVAVAAQRYCKRHGSTVAIIKTLGANVQQVRFIFLMHLLFVSVFSISLGVICGWFLQGWVGELIQNFLVVELPEVDWKPTLLALMTGIICALLFSLRPLLQLFQIQPILVLRKSEDETGQIDVIHVSVSLITIFLLMLIYSGDLLFTLAVYGAGLVLVALLGGMSWVLFKLGKSQTFSTASPWHLALASIRRRAKSSALQFISFAMAINLVLVIFVLQYRLIADWQAQLPEQAPNYFLANVAEEEKSSVKAWIESQGYESPPFYPVVRGRLTGINGQKVVDEPTKEKREQKKREGARVGVGRELNLTWSDTMIPHNEVIEGQWWQPGLTHQVSVEKNVAKRLDVQLGDRLEFLIGDQRIEAEISNIRFVDWNRMQPNFYMVLSPDLLKDFAATYLTSFHLSAEKKSVLTYLYTEYPSVTLIDVDQLVHELRQVIDHVSIAIQFVFIIVVIAAGLVLLAQIQASFEERKATLVILRTLGAQASLLRRSVVLEFMLIGAAAGGVASFSAELSLFLLQNFIFNIQPMFHPMIWLIGPTTGMTIVGLLGYLATHRLTINNVALEMRKVFS
ncbi:ABC transporter permease [Algicola sagamiensis]|uniref:ABC transporter permease n=1 Tax=Algicola sagamiensis TaxID=163869 RepID=UPI0003788016|nr:FtsX-like permease family protein [Algicola sagamiensis]